MGLAVQPVVDDGQDGVLVPEGDCRLIEKRRRQQEVDQPGLGNPTHVPEGEAADFALAAPLDDGGVSVADSIADLPGIHHVRKGLKRFVIERTELIGQGRRHLGQRDAPGLPGHGGRAAAFPVDAGQAFQVGDHVHGGDHILVGRPPGDLAGNDAAGQQHPSMVLADLAQLVELLFGDGFGIIPQDALPFFLGQHGVSPLCLVCQRQEESRMPFVGYVLS